MKEKSPNIMEKALTKAFWEKIRIGEAYGELRKQIVNIYNETRYDNIPVLTFSSRMRYYSDGDRAEFEQCYFRRRKYLASTALLALIYADNELYIKETEEIIWAICEEYNWAIPAHCNVNDTTVIDLFNAETAFSLAEIHYLLKDRLDCRIVERITIELQKRIVDNYNNHTYSWENAQNNWAAVCAGNIGGVLMYMFPDEFEKNKYRLISAMHSFLRGFPNDGTCLEGPLYWHYGFGNFVWFSDLLCQYTHGKKNLFKEKKIKNIVGYMQRSILKGNTVASFADSSPNMKFDYGLVDFLRKIFPEEVSAIDPENCFYWQGNVMWMQFFRSIYYLESPQTFEKKVKNYYLPYAGQAIINREKYSLAIKAGHNNEPHNHNDVGSFILSTVKGQVVCDIGSSSYTLQYFAPETRYTHFSCSSAGHNVPIINGLLQKEGKNYKGTLKYDDQMTVIDFKAAYDIQELKKLERIISYTENTVTVADSFDINYDTFTERFISRFKPEISEAEVKLADVVIKYDYNKCKAVIKEVDVEPQVDFDSPPHGSNITVYCVDFILNKGLDKISFDFII